MLQLVSRHEIENQEIGFKKFGMELRRVVGLHQILAGNVITCLEPLLNCRFKFWCCGYTLFFLGLGLTVTEINIKKGQKQDLKNIKNVKRCRDGMPKSMQTR